jgi:hypothetical protein
LNSLETLGLTRPIHAVAFFTDIDNFTEREFQALEVDLVALIHASDDKASFLW